VFLKNVLNSNFCHLIIKLKCKAKVNNTNL
jgi:hypothetical protein